MLNSPSYSGSVAQWIEVRLPKPNIPGSIPGLVISPTSHFDFMFEQTLKYTVDWQLIKTN